MDETWFTSDLHFGHRRIIELCNRPFADVDEMNLALIQNWNEIVDPSDTIFVLGDVAMGRLAETLPLTAGLNGTKLLVPGNHDSCWQGHKKVRPRDIEAYEGVGFKLLKSQVTLGTWLLCHFPTAESAKDSRYAAYHPTQGKHEAVIHGHVHNAWKVNGRQINVGVDVWNYKPVHFDELRWLIRSMSRSK